MIIKFFKSQQPLAYFTIAVTGVLFWIIGYFVSFAINAGNAMPLYNFLLTIINPGYRFAYFLIGLALVVSQAIHLNVVIKKHDVLYKSSYLPGLFYIVLMSCIPQFISFHPVLIVNSILIFAIDKIFRLYKNESPLSLDFDICVLLSIMAMVYLPAAMFIILYFIAIIILRPFSWRDWVVGLMGLITPVYFVLLYYFLTDSLHQVKDLVFASGISREFNIKNVVPAGYSLTIGWIVIIFTLSIIKIRDHFYKNTAKTRNYQQIILFFIILALLMIIFTPSPMLYRFSILCIPLSVIVAYYFLASKKEWVTESLFALFIIITIYNFISAG